MTSPATSTISDATSRVDSEDSEVHQLFHSILSLSPAKRAELNTMLSDNVGDSDIARE
ncbi:MAG: hypothetical protein ABGZ35_20275 [Planctomycetaceae bacterium]|jgi:hypothetical protein